MKRAMLVPTVIAALAAAGAAFAGPVAPPRAKGGLAPPPAIYLPYGAKIVTELNFSDDDVLAVIKQLIPMLGDFANIALRSAPPGMAAQKQPVDPKIAGEVISSMDFNALAGAVEGVKNVRVLIATYRPGLKPEAVLKQLQAGVAKAGCYRKIASDIAVMPGPCAFYAEAQGNGYMALAYDPKGGMLYAGRVVGRVDVPKLVKWGTDLAKAFAGAMGVPPVEEKKE